MAIYSLDVPLLQFWTFMTSSVLQLDLHTGILGGGWGGLLFTSLEEFSRVVTHTVKGFNIVSGAEVDVFVQCPCFSYDPADVGNLISSSSTFCKYSMNSGTSRFMYCWSPAWRLLSITLLACGMRQIAWQFEHSSALPFFQTGMKLTFFNPVAAAEFSKFAGTLNAVL